MTVACLCALPSAATADPMAEARRSFQRGERQYAAGNYDAALGSYARAHELSQLPGFLFNIGACHHQLEHWAEARDSLVRYLALVPDAPNRGDAERLIAEAAVHLPPPVAEPPPTPDPPAPAEPELPPEPPPPAPARSVGVLTWTALGTGVALAVGAVLFAVDLGAAQSDLDDPSVDCTIDTIRCHDLRDRGERAATFQLVLGGAAAAALAAAGVLLVLDLFAPGESEAPARVTVGPGHVRLEATW